MINEYGAVDGITIGRENHNTQKKNPAPFPLCPLQISHGLTQHKQQQTE
jgi:hypothetical protein